jgi:hypothetical protein
LLSDISKPGTLMAKAPTPDMIAAGLTATERVLLFCIGTGTDWRKVVTPGTAQQVTVRGLFERDGSGFIQMRLLIAWGARQIAPQLRLAVGAPGLCRHRLHHPLNFMARAAFSGVAFEVRSNHEGGDHQLHLLGPSEA